ncbi:hypothetical protein I316_03820 [Kwoniella heveanensis BCC8398]|uniref:glucan 1,4-alpha-glucosidase n=1 Tax=Kwoniella heveanensis BCC8398 TaxID=1296120 RepID=A0A1B9GTG2_9TREE|nr:hypothetical protein I316_03820 [Kwoniella heveanensis BCC8398]
MSYELDGFLRPKSEYDDKSESSSSFTTTTLPQHLLRIDAEERDDVYGSPTYGCLDRIPMLSFPSTMKSGQDKHPYIECKQEDHNDTEGRPTRRSVIPDSTNLAVDPSVFERLRGWYASFRSKPTWWIAAGIVSGMITYFAICVSLVEPSTPDYSEQRASPAPEWMLKEKGIAVQKILKNIGPIIGANDGLVVASPSHGERDDLPDYYFTWTRDSALVFSALNQLWLLPPSHSPTAASATASKINLFRSYIISQARIQDTPNPSGDLHTGGLNEPKFHVNGSAFLGDWGRPQRDGPALRALAIIPYAHYLLDRNYPLDIEFIKHHIYDPHRINSTGKVVKNDLEEVAHHWSQSGFDLWEELDGHHLFTILMSMKALEDGAKLANRLNDSGAANFYLEQAKKIQNSLERFWDNEANYYISGIPDGQHPAPVIMHRSPSEGDKRPEVQTRMMGRGDGWPDRELSDCSLPLSVVHLNQDLSSTRETFASSEHSHDGDEGPHSFHPADPRVIATMYRYILSFRDLYEINSDREWTDGWMLGRYREDLYDGVGKSKANSWFICTHSIAQVFYLAQSSFRASGSIHVSNLTIPFWSDILSERVTPGDRWRKGSDAFERAVHRLGEVADRFLGASRRYWDEGSMSEQVDRQSCHWIAPHGLPKT